MFSYSFVRFVDSRIQSEFLIVLHSSSALLEASRGFFTSVSSSDSIFLFFAVFASGVSENIH